LSQSLAFYRTSISAGSIFRDGNGSCQENIFVVYLVYCSHVTLKANQANQAKLSKNGLFLAGN